MKKNIFKKLFIKISKLAGYEIIDQNEFYSPTLEKNLDEKLSNKKKSIILPLGEVKLTKKIKNLSIIFPATPPAIIAEPICCIRRCK